MTHIIGTGEKVYIDRTELERRLFSLISKSQTSESMIDTAIVMADVFEVIHNMPTKVDAVEVVKMEGENNGN